MSYVVVFSAVSTETLYGLENQMCARIFLSLMRGVCYQALDTSETRDQSADLAFSRGDLVKSILSRSVENLPSTAGTTETRYLPTSRIRKYLCQREIV